MNPARFIFALCALVVHATAGAEDVYFTALDVYLDSDEPVAAWQFELGDRAGTMKVVGVERGEAPAFTRVPYYDRAAVETGQADRVIVADYSLDGIDKLPSGHVRIATVHLMLSGDGHYDLNLITATNYDGERTDAALSFVLRNGREP